MDHCLIWVINLVSSPTTPEPRAETLLCRRVKMCPIDHTARSFDDSSVKSQHALGRVCTAAHAQIWQLHLHWEGYRKPVGENHSSYHNSGLPSTQKLIFGSRDSPARALFRQGLGLQRLGLPEKPSRTHTSCTEGSTEGSTRYAARSPNPEKTLSRRGFE